MNTPMSRNYIKDALLGLAIGDALGVPAEFSTRQTRIENPITTMTGYGAHNQPPGTWSDDSSLTFCLAEMLITGYDLTNLANRFINWLHYGYWTAHGVLFDIGRTTHDAIDNLEAGVPPTLAGGEEETDNGNGSLMRIIPLLFYIKDLPIEERYRYTAEVSSLTHRHIRSIAACFIYLEIALNLLNGQNKHDAYYNARISATKFLLEQELLNSKEQTVFENIISGNLETLPIEKIHGKGYVIWTLESAIWCLLHTNNYKDAVLTAVNLGHDADTTACVTGALAGILYSWEAIPSEWLNILAGKERIEELITNLQAKIYN